MILKTSLTRKFVLAVAPMLAAAMPVAAHAQYNGSYGNGNYGSQNYYNGARNGYGNGGYDYDHRYDQRDQYRNEHYREYRDNDRNTYNDDRNYNDHRGGIGPGKGALIGGAGGAALGAIFGGGLKGALIGGGAGAGIGAIAGKVHQDHQRDQYGYYPR